MHPLPFLPSRAQVPQTTRQTQPDTNPRMRQQAKLAQHDQLERTARHGHKRRGQRAGGQHHREHTREHRKPAEGRATDQEPEPGHVQEIAVPADLAHFAGEEDERGQQDDGEEGGVVEGFVDGSR